MKVNIKKLKRHKPNRLKGEPGPLKVILTKLGHLTFHMLKLWPIVPILGLCALIFYQVNIDPAFTVKKVVVNQCSHITKQQLMKYVQFRIGQNIFMVNLGQLRDRLAEHPWVRRVSVRRELPDKIIVFIEEHRPMALIQLDDLYYVDDHAMVFKRVESGDPRDFPILTGFTRADFLEGGKRTQNMMERLKETVKLLLLAESQKALPISQISEVRYEPQLGYSLITNEKGIQIRIGDKDFSTKLRNLAAVLDLAKKRGMTLRLVDLLTPGQAVIRQVEKVG